VRRTYGYAATSAQALQRGRWAFFSSLLEEIEQWMAAHPHLKGAKLDASGNFLRLDRTYDWDDIVLEPAVRAAVDRHVVQFVGRLDRYRTYGLSTKRGVLLAGPPGTGKTLLGKILCCQVPTTFVWVSPSEMGSPGELARLFCLARECQPTILFLEDLDLYASRRDFGGDTTLLGALLNQLDGFSNNSGILTLATTNELAAIEPALAERPSRFDQLLRLDPPGPAGRQTLLRRFLRAVPDAPTDLEDLVAASQGLTGAHLQEVVHLALQQALDRQAVGASDPPCVTREDLREAIRAIRQPREKPVGQYA
jgi:cell division protease FtsH